MSEFAAQRKLLRHITADVTQNECVNAMIEYVYCKLPKYYQKLDMSNPQKVATFLVDHKSTILALPGGILDREEKLMLFPKQIEHFSLRNVRISTLAIIVRYFLPINGGPPEPTSSIWKTRLKLLGNTSALHYFIRLWRLWNKYQHNEQMNQSKDEILCDFHSIEVGIPAMIPHSATLIMRKIDRFRRFISCSELEKSAGVLRNILKLYDVIADDLRHENSHFDALMCRNKGLDRVLIASMNQSKE